jgi:hypothetical protein
MRTIRFPLLFAFFVAGCGSPAASGTPNGAPASPPRPAASGDAPSSAASSEPTPVPTAAPSSIASTDAVDAGAKPPRITGPVTLEAHFHKDAPRSMFPKATVGEHECWQGVGLTGDHAKDFAMLIGRCGTPTGLAEYVTPVTGHIHHKHKRRDVYTLHLEKGLCYRYFAAGDSTIADLDILVLRNGALIADDKTTQPIAIIEGDRPWCMDHDETYDFSIEVEGPGHGKYMFGVWAKPKG